MGGKHPIKNWPLLVIMGVAFMLLSLVPREIALRYGFDKTAGNVIFIASIGIMIFLYAMLVEALLPLFDMVLRLLQFKPKKPDGQATNQSDAHPSNHSPGHNGSKNLVIDYASTRRKTLCRQEARKIAVEEKIVEYVGQMMSPYISIADMERLISSVVEFIHMTTKPDFGEEFIIKAPSNLTTTDLMHFGWNIAKPFHKPCIHTASFLKQIFPDAFRNTEIYTIEKKLRMNPLQGLIKINPDIGGNHKTPGPARSASKKPERTDSAMAAALADMAAENIPTPYDIDIGQTTLDEEEVA